MKKLWQWLVTALLVSIFLSLANWQWNRADELKNPVEIDQTIVPLDSLIAPSESITQEQVGRRVSLTGRYVSFWQAPNQQPNKEGNRTWDIGLFKTKDNAMILIARGFHKNSSPILSESKVIGYLLPQQSSDVAQTMGNQLGRVDSSLFVSKTELPLYAGFVQAISETPPSGYEVIPFEIGKKVPGYYWQHISYVIIWILFAITVVFLLFYQRKLDRVQL